MLLNSDITVEDYLRKMETYYNTISNSSRPVAQKKSPAIGDMVYINNIVKIWNGKHWLTDHKYRDPASLKLSISDLKLLKGLIKALDKNNPWTEKQQSAAVMLIFKYRKQLKEKFDDDVIEFVKTPVFENSPRTLQIEKTILYKDNHFVIKSPFIKEMVERFRHNRCEVVTAWNNIDREWRIEGSVPALGLIIEVINMFGPFEIDEHVKQLITSYNKALDIPTPPTVKFDNQFIFEHMTDDQINVATDIISSSDSIEVKVCKLAEAEFKLDNTVRSALPRQSIIGQNILMNSVITVNAADINLIELISFIDENNPGPIFISYGWSGDIIENKIEQLKVIYPDRIKVLTYPIPRNQLLPNRSILSGDPDYIYIKDYFKDVVVNTKLTTLIEITGLIRRDSANDLISTSFMKVILFQPSL